ncbi:MAG: tryptophan dimethylallyltransferase family protein [Polyangiaceae bacterium]
MELDDQFAEYATTLATMFGSWAETEVTERPPYLSLIGDDYSPFEYSISFVGDRCDLRLLWEVQGESPGASANQRAAVAFTDRIAARYGASLARFEMIRDLFMSHESPGQFSLWHGLRFDARVPDLKIYLNPQTFGPARALPLVREALVRLGLRDAVPVIEQTVSARGGRDELSYFSLDLSADHAARVKVYFRHNLASAWDIEKIFAVCPSHRAGDVVDFSLAMVGNSDVFQNKAVTSCFAFTQASTLPTAATFHLPIAHYAPDDATSLARSAAFLAAHGQGRAGEKLTRAARGLARRPLESGIGVQSYSSFRREGSQLRFTAYLSPELYREADVTGSYSRLSLRSPPDDLTQAVK